MSPLNTISIALPFKPCLVLQLASGDALRTVRKRATRKKKTMTNLLSVTDPRFKHAAEGFGQEHLKRCMRSKGHSGAVLKHRTLHGAHHHKYTFPSHVFVHILQAFSKYVRRSLHARGQETV